MAGAGYRLFNTGDVLTAAQVNQNLQEQVVMVFADATARTTALSGVLAEGMITYLKSDDKVYKYTGSAWVEVGGGTSPLTTKGDLYTYSTADARLGVGSNNQQLLADSAQTTGLKWAASATSTLSTTGDILYASSANTLARLGIGSTGQVLTVASGIPSWATAAGASGPLFLATRDSSNQSLTVNTNVKMQFNKEVYDTDSCYDPSTNYRFTPNKSGYYQVNLFAWIDNGASGDAYFRIYKNGAEFMTVCATKMDNETMGGATLVSLNGTTDYIEAYIYSTVSGATLRNGDTRSNFSAVWIRS